MNRLQITLETLVTKIQNRCPGVSIKVGEKTFGDEDVDLYVRVPHYDLETMRRFLREETLNILLEQDVDIVPLVYQKSE